MAQAQAQAQAQATAKQATSSKKGQAAKGKAAVQQARTYPTVPAGYGTHGMYNANGQLNQQGHVPAGSAMFATPAQLGLTPSAGIPGPACPVVMCPIQPGIGAKYTSAYQTFAAAHAAACKANSTKQPTLAQVTAHLAPWPANRPKANSCLRHVARTLGVAWAQPK